MSSPGPRISMTFGVGGASPKVRSKLGSVSADVSGSLGLGGIRMPLPPGRKSLFFQNGDTAAASLVFYAAEDTGFVRSVSVPSGHFAMLPIDDDIGWLVATGSGEGRVLVLR